VALLSTVLLSAAGTAHAQQQQALVLVQNPEGLGVNTEVPPRTTGVTGGFDIIGTLEFAIASAAMWICSSPWAPTWVSLQFESSPAKAPAVSDSRYSRVEAYGVSNVRLGLRRGDRRWDIALWVRNMFDQDYFQQSALRSTGWIAAAPGDPRTLGVTLRGQY
jgi:outer membrane receptor protein involved in Fe transport